MTAEQYARWKDFSYRMVNIVRNARHKSPSRAQVKENITFFFECRMDPYEEWRRVRDWDHTERTDGDRHPMCVGDHISDLAEHFIPGYWSLPYEDEKPGVYDKARNRWVGPVACCVRAGLDMASEPSAGVIGFTAGDVRRMYPEGVPAWVFPPNERLHYWLSDELNGTFVELPDEAQVVL
jgi:hypothetical protein